MLSVRQTSLETSNPRRKLPDLYSPVDALPWPSGIQLPEEVTQGWLCSLVPLLTERANAVQSPRSSQRSLGLGTKRVETTKVSDHCGDVSSHL